MYLMDIFTISANLAGIPGMSVPCGFSNEGHPIGLQLMGKHFNEEMLFKVAYNFEQATDFHKKKPNLNPATGLNRFVRHSEKVSNQEPVS